MPNWKKDLIVLGRMPSHNILYLFRNYEQVPSSRIATTCRGPLPLATRGCETPQYYEVLFPNCAKQEPFHADKKTAPDYFERCFELSIINSLGGCEFDDSDGVLGEG